MADPRVSIQSEGGTSFEARLLAFEENIEKIPLVAAEVFKGLEEHYDRTWGDGESVRTTTTDRWPDWKPLLNTGTLKNSLTKSDAPGAIRRITPYGFEFGTSIFYAKFLQRGTRKMRRHPPVKDPRSTRALVGYLVRQIIMRRVVPLD